MARVNCPVCASPLRQRIDSLQLVGWRADKIVQTLENAPVTAKEIKAHHLGLHVGANHAALVAAVIGLMQELWQIDTELPAHLRDDRPWITDPAKSKKEGKVPELVEIGSRISLARARESRLLGYVTKQVEARMKALELLARLAAGLGEKRGQRQPQAVTQDNLATAVKRDPEIISRIMKASLKRQGYEIRLREKAAKG
jgi:hypothetical protein